MQIFQDMWNVFTLQELKWKFNIPMTVLQKDHKWQPLLEPVATLDLSSTTAQF
jgi:hypothetical protein